jgi:hypothetical protein
VLTALYQRLIVLYRWDKIGAGNSQIVVNNVAHLNAAYRARLAPKSFYDLVFEGIRQGTFFFSLSPSFNIFPSRCHPASLLLVQKYLALLQPHKQSTVKGFATRNAVYIAKKCSDIGILVRFNLEPGVSAVLEPHQSVSDVMESNRFVNNGLDTLLGILSVINKYSLALN